MSDLQKKLKADLALVSEESSGSEEKEDSRSGFERPRSKSPKEEAEKEVKSPTNMPEKTVQSPLKLKIKLGPNKSGELITEEPIPEAKTPKLKIKTPLPPQVTNSDEGFHGFTEEEIPMFVYNSFDGVDLKSPIKLKPTMFVSISSKKGNDKKKISKPVPALKVPLDLPGPEPTDPSPRTPKVRFADQVTEDENKETPKPESVAIDAPVTPVLTTPKAGSGSVNSAGKKMLKFWEPLYDGWMREIVVREDKSASNKTRKDVYYHSPQIEGKPRLKFKNANELEGHLITSGSMYPLPFFSFKKEPLGAPEPMEIIRDANTTKSPAKQPSEIVDSSHQHLEKRVSKNPERLINQKAKAQQKKSNKKMLKQAEQSPELPPAAPTDVRSSKRVIKPPEIFDPEPTAPQQSKKKVSVDLTKSICKADSSGLWKDPDNIMSPKKSVTISTGKSGTGLLKVKMFSKLNAKNVSDSVKSSKDTIDDTGIFDDDMPVDPLGQDPPIDPLALGPEAPLDNIAVSDEESLKINEDDEMIGVVASAGKHKNLPRLTPVPQSSLSYVDKVLNMSTLPSTISIQRSSHLPIRPVPTASLSITPLSSSLYPNMQSAQDAIYEKTITTSTNSSVRATPTYQHDLLKVLYPLKKTLLPCSIHCPGATGFPSLSCKSCHCLFHPKCVGLSSQHLTVFKNSEFFCNDCNANTQTDGPLQKNNTQKTIDPKEARTGNLTRNQAPMAQRPQHKMKPKQTHSQSLSHPIIPQPQKTKPSSQKPNDKASRPEVPAPPRPIEHQAVVNIGGKKFLVIPRADLALDSPPPSPPQSQDGATVSDAPRKLPVFLKSADDRQKIGPDFEVEQARDGSIIIKPLGDVNPVSIFGSNKLKRPLKSNKPDEISVKRPKLDFNHFHSAVTDGYFALRQVFKYLSVNDRLRAGQVCRLWNEISNHHSFWTSLSLKNLKVTDWECFSTFIRRVCCQSIDMRKMIFVKDRDVTWSDILTNMKNFPSLKQLQLPRLSGSVLISMVQELKHLEVLNAPLITSPLNTATFKSFSNIKELRLKTGSGQLVLENGLKFLEPLSGTLTSLSLLTVSGLTESDYDSIGMLTNLEQVELGDCTGAPITLFKTLSDLSKLVKIRLEKGTVGDTISKLQRGDNLRQLELIDFHIKVGFREGLKGLNNVRKLLIIPTYKDEVAASNTQILEGITAHLKHLESFYLGVTNEWLQAMSVVIGENQKSKSPGERECFPLEKDGKVEYISLPGLYRKVCREMPNTKVKVLKMSAGATCKQFIRSLDK